MDREDAIILALARGWDLINPFPGEWQWVGPDGEKSPRWAQREGPDAWIIKQMEAPQP